MMMTMRCALRCASLFAVVAMTPLLLLPWSLCHCCNEAVTVIAPAPLPLLCWYCYHHYAGVIAMVALVSLHFHAGIVTHFVTLALLQPL